jgi:hypothetical protein
LCFPEHFVPVCADWLSVYLLYLAQLSISIKIVGEDLNRKGSILVALHV